MHVSGLTISGTTAVVIGVVVLVVIIAIAWAYKTANRLDRLNVRVDLARGALEAALARRAVVARLIGDGLLADAAPDMVVLGGRLIEAADVAESASVADREEAENALSALLARVRGDERRPGALTELTDASTRVMMARRFYNDAVRDTRSLGERRPVRWLRLGGTAALPEYFEISER